MDEIDSSCETFSDILEALNDLHLKSAIAAMSLLLALSNRMLKVFISCTAGGSK